MESSLDAKRLVYLPLWARIFCIVTLGVGLLLSSAVVIGYFGSSDNRDWVLIGLTSAQFLITTLVIAVVLFVANRRYDWQFDEADPTISVSHLARHPGVDIERR